MLPSHHTYRALLLAAAVALAGPPALAQKAVSIKPLAEMKVSELPPGELVWRVENFDTREKAQGAATRWSLVAEAAGKVWLFTLGAPGGSSPGGTKVTEVGPIKRPAASEYLLRINEASGAPGAVTSVHSHPGSEAFFVLAGEQSIRSPLGVQVVKPGQPEAGAGPGMPMQVSSTGQEDLKSLVMFVVDAGKPFSTPGSLP